jgi:epoxyqueuosine reductase
LKLPLLIELAALDDAAFRQRFAGTPVKRLGRDRFLRNVAIALGNSGSADALPALEQLLGDQSPLVKEAAMWARDQI